MPAAPRTLRALVAVAVLSSGAAAAAGPATIADDYAGARAEAKRLGVPILVDVWAPW
jgi:hypothetical protein